MLGLDKPLSQLYRAKDRVGLLTSSEAYQYKQKIILLKKMKIWLKKEGIKKFDSYYRIALSNRYVFGSEIEKGLKGFLLCVWGLIIYPKNPGARNTFKTYIKRIYNQ